MSLQRWIKLSTETVCKNPHWEHRRDRFRMEDGREGVYDYMWTGGGVCVFPVDAQGRIVLVEQFRYLFQRVSLEPPGGGSRAKLSFTESVEAELREEAGLEAATLVRVGSVAALAGISDEEMHVFVADDLSPAFAPGDEFEEFAIVAMTPEEVDAAIQSGRMFNSFAIAAWTLAKPKIIEIIDQQRRQG